MDENMSLVTNGFLHNVFNHKKDGSTDLVSLSAK